MKYRLVTRVRSFLHWYVSNGMRWYYNGIWGTHIGKGTRISTKAKLDVTNPDGIHIGEYTAVTLGCIILSHDFPNNCRHVDVRIGSNCFIGCGSIILPGVTIGDHCIVCAGSLVAKDVPNNCIVGGNPAFIIERNIKTREYGIRIDKAPMVASTTAATGSRSAEVDNITA